MIKKDNAVGRLYEVIAQLRGFPASGVVKTSIANFFGFEDDNSTKSHEKVAYALIEIVKLVDEAECAMRSIPNLNEQLFLKPFPAIRTAFTSMLAGITSNWENARNLLAVIDLTSLAFCAEELSKHHTETQIDPDQLKEILEDIDEAVSSIESSSIPNDLKALLLDQLEAIRRTIYEYRVRGGIRLKEGFQVVVGAVYVNQQVIKNSAAAPEIKKFQKIMEKLKTIMDFALKYKPLAEPVFKFLTGYTDAGDGVAGETFSGATGGTDESNLA